MSVRFPRWKTTPIKTGSGVFFRSKLRLTVCSPVFIFSISITSEILEIISGTSSMEYPFFVLHSSKSIILSFNFYHHLILKKPFFKLLSGFEPETKSPKLLMIARYTIGVYWPRHRQGKRTLRTDPVALHLCKARFSGRNKDPFLRLILRVFLLCVRVVPDAVRRIRTFITRLCRSGLPVDILRQFVDRRGMQDAYPGV